MSRLTQREVLEVLAGQSPGYYIFPNAAAFAAEGFDPGDVAEILEQLHRKGQLTRELLVAGESSEDGELVGGGYRLAGGGDEMSETTDPQPTEPEPTEPTEPDDPDE